MQSKKVTRFGCPGSCERADISIVGYVTLLLAKFNVPADGSVDFSCISDLLLSLESRNDITKLVLEYSLFKPALRRLAREKIFSENNNLNIGSRATALQKHWEKTSLDHSWSSQDVVFSPLLSAVPNKPKDWTLQLTEKAREEAETYYHALKTQRKYAYRCFQAKPPKPMAWAPKSGDAWAKTARVKVTSGDLFHSRDWAPVWMGFELASIDVMLGMEAAGMTQDEIDEYYDAMRSRTEMKKSYHGKDLRSEDILRG